MPVLQYFDVSTANITEKDNEELSRVCYGSLPSAFRAIDHEYGWWIHVSEDVSDDELSGEGLSKAFIALYNKARELKCTWINLDKDGDPEDGLEAFYW